MTVETEKSKILKVGKAGWRPREERVLQFKSQGSLLAEFHLLLEGQVLSFKAFS